MALTTDNGIVNKPSSHSVDQTVEKLKSILQAKGVTLFALIDHSGEAEKVGMKMMPTKLLVFGNPKAGTPLMLAVPSAAIDLPLKLLVWEDGQSKVWISYNSPQYLQQRHGFANELLQNIAVVENLATAAAWVFRLATLGPYSSLSVLSLTHCIVQMGVKMRSSFQKRVSISFKSAYHQRSLQGRNDQCRQFAGIDSASDFLPLNSCPDDFAKTIPPLL